MTTQYNRIFVVDNDEMMIECLIEALSSKGYTVEGADSAEKTIEKIKDWPVDLFLIDILMPGMGGIELLKKLDIKNNMYEAIIITGHADLSSAKEAMQYGAFSYISKPINDKDLYAQVEKALELVSINMMKLDYTEELEESYRGLANSITDVFFAMDRDLRYTYWNIASEKLTGILSKDAIGKSIFDVFPDNKETRKTVKVYKKVLRTKQSEMFVNEYNFGGKRYSFEISVYPTRNGISVFVKDITERKRVEDTLKESEEKLIEQNVLLQEKNIALRQVMDQVKEEKGRIEKQILANVDNLLLPLLAKLKGVGGRVEKNYIDLLEENIKDITSGFGGELSRKMLKLTQKEIEMCNMIKNALTSKEIANLLNISNRTVETHRNNIRKKLGITRKEINLATYLTNL